MNRLESLRNLDWHELPDWPLAAQLATLALLLTTLLLAGLALLLHQDISSWLAAKQQQTELEQQWNTGQQASAAIARIVPLLPPRGLGCRKDEISAIARKHGLELLIGEAGDDARHGNLVEASTPLLINGAYADLHGFATDVAVAETAVVLDQLTLAQGPERRIEFQVRIRCIRQPDTPPTP